MGRLSGNDVAHMRRLIALTIAFPFPAHAHQEPGAGHWWTLDPWIVVPMLLFAGFYARGVLILHRRSGTSQSDRTRIASYCAGMAATFIALIWPLDALGEISFAAHMAQHMMLIAVAAPLFAFAQPKAPLLIAMPSSWRRLNSRLAGVHRLLRLLSRPGPAFAIHGALIWIWHAPLLFEAALQSRWIHIAEHAAFFGSGLLFWNAMRRTGLSEGSGYGTAVMWIVATLMHTGLLGALITFSPRLLYPHYATVGDAPLSPMDDQQLAGLLMWIPAGFCYLIAGLCFAAAWLRHAQRGEQGAVASNSASSSEVPATDSR